MGHFDITWGYKGQWGYVGYIFMGCHTHGGFRFGDLRTYHNLPTETPEAHSQSGKANLLAVPT